MYVITCLRNEGFYFLYFLKLCWFILLFRHNYQIKYVRSININLIKIVIVGPHFVLIHILCLIHMSFIKWWTFMTLHSYRLKNLRRCTHLGSKIRGAALNWTKKFTAMHSFGVNILPAPLTYASIFWVSAPPGSLPHQCKKANNNMIIKSANFYWQN